MKYLSLILFLYLGVSPSLSAPYIYDYDKEMAELLITDPTQSLLISQDNYKKSKKNNNVEKQLISLYYTIESLVTLSKLQEIQPYINQGLQLAKLYNKTQFESEFHAHQAYLLQLQGKFDKAFISINLAMNFAKNSGDERLFATHNLLRGQIYNETNNFDLALIDIQYSIEVFKRHKDRKRLSSSYNVLAITYYSFDDYEKAIKYYKVSEEYDDIKSPYDVSAISYNIAAAYLDSDNYPKALLYYKKSKEAALKVGDKASLAFIDYGVARLFLIQKQYEKSKSKLELAIELFEQNGDEQMLFNSRLMMSEIYTQLKLFDETLGYLEQAKNQKELFSSPRIQLDYLHQYLDYLKNIGNWEKSYQTLLQINEVNSKYEEQDKEQLISELSIKFNAQFDHEKIELLKKQNELQRTSINLAKSERLYLFGFIALSLLVLLITIVAYILQRKTKKHLYMLSSIDSLTNVSNRRKMISILSRRFSYAKKHNKTFAIVMIDLDYFKKINDTFGHDAGNDVLICFAQLAQSKMEHIGSFGRIGGEEWLMIIKTETKDNVLNLLKSLRKDYANSSIQSQPAIKSLCFSSGISFYNSQFQNIDQMLSKADHALYKAKADGRNRDVFSD